MVRHLTRWTDLLPERLLLLPLLMGLCGHAGSADLADPFRPPPLDKANTKPATPEVNAGGWQLQAILLGPDRRLVVINAQVLRAGERLGEAVVHEIAADRAVLEHNGERFTRSLRQAPAEPSRTRIQPSAPNSATAP